MTGRRVDAVARTLLYEGYMLYPYRPSAVKNQHRFNFGVLYPRAYSETQTGNDAWTMRTECPLRAADAATLDVTVRFLQTRRGVTDCAWQEAVERELALTQLPVRDLLSAPALHRFEFGAASGLDPVDLPADRTAATITGELDVSARTVAEGVIAIAVEIRNTTPPEAGVTASRDHALTRSMISTHTILRVRDGEFVSLLEPPDDLASIAAACHNTGTWPVLAGDDDRPDCVLSSPIILYDYPQIAPESMGDLFDGTEIDEILALRILTLTDDEKREIRESDGRAREMLDRTEALPAEQFAKLHGAIRGLRPTRSGEQG